MRGTRGADLTVASFSSIDALPPGALALMDAADGIFAGRGWWSVVLLHAMPKGGEAVFVVVQSAQRVTGVLPLLRIGGRLGSLTTPYSCAFAPLVAADLDTSERIGVLAAMFRFCRSVGVTRLDALAPETDVLTTAAVAAGLRTLWFDHFGNWHEDVGGLDWPAYLQLRAGALRETIKRRLRRAEKLADGRFELFTAAADMDLAAEAFESVYARSWKEPEPYPAFNVALMRSMAEAGQLRFGVWSIGADRVAVQLWVVKDGHATVLKLAHDEAFKAHSPGTVLSALMLRHLLDQEHVTRIDFGRGDDVYKQGWATQRTQRVGVLLVNPWRVSGAVAWLRHCVGRIRAGLRVV